MTPSRPSLDGNSTTPSPPSRSSTCPSTGGRTWATSRNLPIVIEQRKPAFNSRSTVGTYTDIYALLRLLFSRIGQPFVGYSDAFSFNHPSGSCPRCGGLGEIRELDIHKLVDFDKSLNDEDTIHHIAFGKGGGAMGGDIIFEGTPKAMAEDKGSVTGPYLRVN